MKSLRLAAAVACLAGLALHGVAYSNDPVARVRSVGTAVLGRADAPVTLVEFSDYECSFCQQYHADSFESIKRDFIDTGKVRYVVRDFPLPRHKFAMGAARAVRCAGEQGKFWEMRSAVFRSTDALNADAIAEIGGTIKVAEGPLRACMATDRHDAGIRKDMEDAAAAGVTATPAFVLGLSAGDGVKGERFLGALPYADFAARINALLESAPREGRPPRSALR
jgi:protein-disulfide isomerase